MEKGNDQLTLSGYIEGINKEKSPDVQEVLPRRKLDKIRWYTAPAGIEFRTGPLGSDVGGFLGRTIEPTKIRRVSNGVVRHNGIASISAIIEVDNQLRQAWFNIKDIRAERASGKAKK